MAQTLKFGNGTWATKKDSILAYNDENENYKPLPFNYTGAGKGTRVNKEGLIEVVENDRPRIDYKDSEDGVFLLENAATNLITYSEDFSNSSWTKSNSTVTSGFTSPDGTTNAFKLIENTSSTTEHRVYVTMTSAVSTYSVRAKKAERNWIYIVAGGKGAYFNLENGIIGASNTTANIKALSNGWYECSILTAVLNGSTANIMVAKGDGLEVYTGDGTSGVYIYGAQLEVGNLASSYIPTQGSATTRVQETASGSGNSEVFNDSEGVLFADIAAFEETNSFEAISINDNSTSDRIFMGYYSDDLYITVIDGGQAKYDVNTPINVKQNNKIAVKYKAQDFSFYLNGFEIDASVGINGGTTPSGLSQLGFNRGDGVEPFYGKTKEIAYYDEVLTDLELETLTSYRTWESMVKELNLNVIYNG
jgi:hypothetical protein